MRRNASYGEVALGVECALPAAFAAKHRPAPRFPILARLIDAGVRFGVLLNRRLAPSAPRR